MRRCRDVEDVLIEDPQPVTHSRGTAGERHPCPRSRDEKGVGIGEGDPPSTNAKKSTGPYGRGDGVGGRPVALDSRRRGDPVERADAADESIDASRER
jgi:hypothetical protein